MDEIRKQEQEYREKLETARKRKSQLDGIHFDYTKKKDELNAQIPILLNEIYIKGNEYARSDLREINLDIMELNQVKHHIPELIRAADNEVNAWHSKHDEIKRQVDHYNRQDAHWRAEYEAACGRLANATFANIDVIERRLMECARHHAVQKVEEAEALVSLRKGELDNE
jgi:hypothetical protein